MGVAVSLHEIQFRVIIWVPNFLLKVIGSAAKARAGTVTCFPKVNKSKTKQFKVHMAYVRGQVTKISFRTGKSGGPHYYDSGDDIVQGDQRMRCC